MSEGRDDKWHMRGDGQSFIHGIRHHGSLWSLFTDAILAYRERTQVIQQQSVDLRLISTRLETIHGLVFDLVTSLTTDPEKIAQLAASVKAVREKLKTSVDNQTKEN